MSEAFIIPALKVANTYRRSVGYFSSSVFETILEGVENLESRGGKIQIITSPNLNQDDIKAIELGYDTREEIVSGAFFRDFDNAINELNDSKLQMAARLIANDVLDIKIVDMENGLYHDKFGIIEDEYGNTVAFRGSSNETFNGLKNNYETNDVYVSWNPVLNQYVQNIVTEFDSIWNNTNQYLNTYSFNEAIKEHILRVQEHRGTSIKVKASTSTMRKQDDVVLRDYQEEAIKAWVKNSYHGFYVMATGTGKTLTAIYSVVELQKEHDCLTVICAPYRHLISQWKDDIKKTFPEAKIILVSSDYPKWDIDLTYAIISQKRNPQIKIFVISTISSFSMEKFTNTINKSQQEKLLIVDEAHRFTQRPEKLKNTYQYMLGLSATPFTGRNTASGNELMNFFGGRVFNLPIEEALKRKCLVQYYYYPIFVHATDEEESKFKYYTSKIIQCYNEAGICVDPDNLVKYLHNRLRIIAMAEEKTEHLPELISKVPEKDHFIVYCGDGRFFNDKNEEIRYISLVNRQLDELGFKPSQFTASEDLKTRLSLIDSFNNGEIDTLTAIRCLDEGINIPSIKSALVLASNDNNREFVQRRGRILRLYEGKEYANIYDVIVLPSTDTPKMAEIELRRFYEYARLAVNAEENLETLNNIAAKYKINIDDLIINDDEEFKEAPLDD